MKFIPDNVEESGLSKVISYIWSYRRGNFMRFSLILQIYLLVIVLLAGIKLFNGEEKILNFGLTFVVPALMGYGILTVLYVILYVDVIRVEKDKRKEKLKGKLLSANPSR